MSNHFNNKTGFLQWLAGTARQHWCACTLYKQKCWISLVWQLSERATKRIIINLLVDVVAVCILPLLPWSTFIRNDRDIVAGKRLFKCLLSSTLPSASSIIYFSVFFGILFVFFPLLFSHLVRLCFTWNWKIAQKWVKNIYYISHIHLLSFL